jgi:hypothetical protein
MKKRILIGFALLFALQTCAFAVSYAAFFGKVTVTTSVNTQPGPVGCPKESLKQFDFWIGDWDAYYQAPNGAKLKASNSVRRTLGGCVVEENFTDDPASANQPSLRGHSVSAFVVRENKWKQTWVDNTGAYLDFAGEFANGEMVLQRTGTDRMGRPIKQRMVWSKITTNDFDWKWETSHDGGKSWALAWHLHYVRKGTASAISTPRQTYPCGDALAWNSLPFMFLRMFLVSESCD